MPLAPVMLPTTVQDAAEAEPDWFSDNPAGRPVGVAESAAPGRSDVAENGAVTPSEHSLSLLTQLIASKRSGFTMLDWDRELEGLAGVFGVVHDRLWLR